VGERTLLIGSARKTLMDSSHSLCTFKMANVEEGFVEAVESVLDSFESFGGFRFQLKNQQKESLNQFIVVIY
jgi:hypothetical protein